MKTTKILGLLCFGLLLGIFLINVIYAQTLVAGKVYTSGYNDVVSDVNITVTCNSNKFTTTSLNDGTYAVRFEQSLCSLGDNVNVKGVKGSLTGSGTGKVIECDNQTQNDCSEGYVSVINLAIKTKQTSGSNADTSNINRGSICTYNQTYNWNCSEWSECTNGVQTRTCRNYNNCGNSYGRPALTQTCTTPKNTGNGDSNTETQTSTNPETTNSSEGGLSRITGAATGATGGLGMGWAIIIALIILIAGISLTARQIRKRKAVQGIYSVQ